MRRYSIESHDGYFLHAGRMANNEQVLIGLSWPHLVAFQFDVDGSLVRTSERPIAVAPDDPLVWKTISDLIDAWKSDLEFRPSVINIQKFFSQEHHIGIQDYPAVFQEVLSDPAAGDEEKADIHESMQFWDEDSQFVLIWMRNDFWVNQSGQVVSS